ncbi:MAG TPA: TonB-dependent receptor [Acidisarcina sp.]
MRKLLHAILLLALARAPAGTCASAHGTLIGSVADQTGAAIPGATIIFREEHTSFARAGVTGQSGDYSEPLLPPGIYSVTFSAAGFRRTVLSHIALDVDQTERLDVSLQVGSVTETIIVTGQQPLLETDSSGVGNVLGAKQVATLPLNERDFLSFALLVPGVHTPIAGSDNSTQGGSISVNGGREMSNNFVVDGSDNNDALINRRSVLPSVDAIEEFKVQASTYSAEYGRNSGAQINVVLKSGSNQMHGSVFEFFRNRQLDARDYFDQPACKAASAPGTCAPIPRYQRDQFGGTAGGPLSRSRAFFFAAYEGLRLRQAFTRQSTVPSQAERAALLAAVPASYANAAGLAALNLFPAANVGADLIHSNTYVASPVAQNAADKTSIKLDYQVRPGDVVSAHYVLFRDAAYNPYDFSFFVSNLPGYGDNARSFGHNLGIDWVHLFSPHLLSDARFGLNRDRQAVFQQNEGTDQSARIGFPSPGNLRDFGFPIVQVQGYEVIGEPFSAPQDNEVNTFQYAENVTWDSPLQNNHHHFKLGVDIRRLQDNGYFDFYPRGYYAFLGLSGSPLEDLLLGIPAVTLSAQGDSNVHLRGLSWSAYIQDDVHLTSGLTINAGLRYEYNAPAIDIHNHLSTPDLSGRSAGCTPLPDCQFLQAGTSGVPRSIYTISKLNLAPRLGFAWQATADRKMVVRGGYGIFFDQPILTSSELGTINPPFYRFAYFYNSGTNTIQNILSSPANVTISIVPASRQVNPYMQHWSAGAQYALRNDLSLELTYVGSKGTHLLGTQDNNQSEPGGSPPYPQFGSLATVATGRASRYDSLQLQADKRFERNLAFLLAYTWSKSIDNGSEYTGSEIEGQYPQNSHDLAGERGLSGFDARNRLATSVIYGLPFGAGQRWSRSGTAAALLGGWQVTSIIALQSGTPFTINRVGYQSYTTLVTGTDRPDQVADPMAPGPVEANADPACHTTLSHGGRAADKTRTAATWFNPCAFSDPNLLGERRFGTARRNSVIGPALRQADISISRSFHLGREHSLLARADAFNVLNHPNWGIPTRQFDSRGFSSIETADEFGSRPPRQIQVALKLSF